MMKKRFFAIVCLLFSCGQLFSAADGLRLPVDVYFKNDSGYDVSVLIHNRDGSVRVPSRDISASNKSMIFVGKMPQESSFVYVYGGKPYGAVTWQDLVSKDLVGKHSEQVLVVLSVEGWSKKFKTDILAYHPGMAIPESSKDREAIHRGVLATSFADLERQVIGKINGSLPFEADDVAEISSLLPLAGVSETDGKQFLTTLTMYNQVVQKYRGATDRTGANFTQLVAAVNEAKKRVIDSMNRFGKILGR